MVKYRDHQPIQSHPSMHPKRRFRNYAQEIHRGFSEHKPCAQVDNIPCGKTACPRNNHAGLGKPINEDNKLPRMNETSLSHCPIRPGYFSEMLLPALLLSHMDNILRKSRIGPFDHMLTTRLGFVNRLIFSALQRRTSSHHMHYIASRHMHCIAPHGDSEPTSTVVHQSSRIPCGKQHFRDLPTPDWTRT